MGIYTPLAGVNYSIENDPAKKSLARGKQGHLDDGGAARAAHRARDLRLHNRKLEGNTMIGTLIGIIIVLIVLGVLYWAITQLLPLIPLPEPFQRIIHVLLVLILVLVVLWVILQILGAVVSLPAWLHVGSIR